MAQEKIKIVALFGAAASGKDSILNWIERSYPDKVSKIISCTTRPPRSNEEDGQDYHFLTKKEFVLKKRNGEMLEVSKFREWFYGTPKSELNNEKINIGVFNIKGIQQLLKNPDIEVIAICVVANELTRMNRYVKRENHTDMAEFFRRFKADKKDMEKINFKYVIWNNSEEYTNAFEKDIAWEKEFNRCVGPDFDKVYLGKW